MNQKEILLRELKAWLLKNGKQEPIAPIISADTIFIGEKTFDEYFTYIENIIKEIVGKDDVLQGEYSFEDITEIVMKLLEALQHCKVIITDQMPPVEERNSREFYMRGKHRRKKDFIRHPAGVRVNLKTGTITRLGEGAGRELEDFNRILPWAGRRRCLLNEQGKVVSYFDDDDSYDPNSTEYDTMVEIPLFYYKRVPISYEGTQLVEWEDWVSYDAKEGYFVHPAFVMKQSISQKVYISAYESSLSNDLQTLVSHPDKPVARDLDIESLRDLANKKGEGWHLMNFDYYAMEQLLLLISTASFDSQTSVGFGISNSQEYKNAGETKDMGTTCGSSANDGNSSVNFFGVENLWSHTWKYLDGASILGLERNLYIGKEFNEDSLRYMTDVCFADGNTKITHFFNDSLMDYVYVPHPTVTEEDTIITGSKDRVEISGNADYKYLLVGGNNKYGDKCGIFSYATETNVDHESISSRIMFYPRGRYIKDEDETMAIEE